MAAERAEAYAARIRAVTAEQRPAATWQACAEDAAVYTLGGLLVGSALGFALVRGGRPFAKGVFTGLGAGAGGGVSWDRCNERFVALQRLAGEGASQPQ